MRASLERAHEALRRSQAETEAVRAANDRFISGVSHELRTPLSAILLWSTLIEEEKLHGGEELREALDVIKRSAEEQQALIENLVATARIVGGRIKLDRRDQALAPIIRSAVDDVRSTAEQKQLLLHEAIEPGGLSAPVDQNYLRQALTHLLRNAVRFTSPAGRVDVLLRQVAEEVQIEVIDTGIGITAEQLPSIFHGPAGNQPKAPRTEAGLGYGLLVARRIVQAHGGTLAASSAGAGRGAVFTIRLPLDASRPIVPAGEEDPDRRFRPLERRHLLLVVGESGAERRTILRALQEAGADVTLVHDVAAALGASVQRPVDGLVCDFTGDGLDPAVFLHAWREHETARHLQAAPALAVSPAHAQATALDAGFDRSLPADLAPPALVAALAECFHPTAT